jgi:hypothetical protein
VWTAFRQGVGFLVAPDLVVTRDPFQLDFARWAFVEEFKNAPSETGWLILGDTWGGGEYVLEGA